MHQDKLVTLIKNNDRDTLEKIYQENFHKVLSYILKNSGTPQQAKDIYQEAFIAMWRNIKREKFKAQNETAINGYIYQIAKNKWIDHLRSARHKKSTALVRDFEDINSGDEEEHQQKIKVLNNALQDMGAKCQELLKLFYYENLSMRDMAHKLDMAESSVRNAKYRCMEQLKYLTQIKKK
ncbi:MAG: hypothetical protein CL868_18910 [Cytophagaceae bacterium]|nr:hypothetical protein [Cytophagaceae bacterium]|tara:strand:- start:4051 stop:4590 length:540 start_codon:yes stop_codon:yes gene_type:complete